ncbi:MAG TPA: DUF4908 domain-containing protein, partial [Rhizomicrobium sp.]|nr:DUF4908 domain-containing protein [Rhizomicrobium sp.]
MARPFIAFAALLALAGASAMPAHAQDDLAARMARDSVGDIQPGEYAAGDNVRFALVPSNGNFLLRFDGNPEVFVLYTDHASLGGRVLKYDSGTTALQVSSWGGVTLYTDAKPNGLPAVRDSDAPPVALAQISLSQLQAAALDETEHLAYTRKLTLNFTADWNDVSASPVLRALCYDTLENAAHGI